MTQNEETPQPGDMDNAAFGASSDAADYHTLDATEITPQPFETITAQYDAPKKGGKHAAPKKHSGGKVFLTVMVVLLGLVALCYVGGAIAFNFIAMPNTTLGGTNVSLKTFSDIAADVESKSSNYTTTIKSTDFEQELSGSDTGLSFDADAYAQGLSSQQEVWMWPAHILESHTLMGASGFTVDASKLKESLTAPLEEHNKTATQPTDATIGYVESEDGFAVIPEQLGTALDLESTVAYVSEQLAGLPNIITLDNSCFVQASVTSDDENLNKAVENANVYLKADIPLTLGGLDAGTVSKAQISEWIVLDDNQNATLDETKLAEWVKTNIATKYDTAGSARTYTRADGKVITVEAATRYWGNYYGWITDEATLVTQLTEAIKSGSTATLDIPTKQTAHALPDANGRDWGNRYIDCDLSEQYVRMYDDSGSLIWESSCVTGNTSQGYNTPAGVYFLNGNRASGDVELRGATDPSTGEPSYISIVQYWMPFIDNSYAFHDASWRSNFGGSIYTYGGSHGCVNLPSGKASELYNICKVGDVVVVHY